MITVARPQCGLRISHEDDQNGPSADIARMRKQRMIGSKQFFEMCLQQLMACLFQVRIAQLCLDWIRTAKHLHVPAGAPEISGSRMILLRVWSGISKFLNQSFVCLVYLSHIPPIFIYDPVANIVNDEFVRFNRSHQITTSSG